ncbi:MAG TPA: YfhO family protein [Candidatus Eisenbacteria bacterium]|nr:YfhO family protein [Candidatus Eisenbacteria bacterium]
MKFLKKYYPFIFLGLLACILFYKILFFGQILYGTFDNFDYMTSLKYFLVHEISKGNFPLWNPYTDIGVPYLADMTIGTFSIFNIFYFLFSIPQAISFIAVVEIFLLSVFQYMYLHALKISKMGSIFGAVVLAYSGTIFPNIGAVDTLPSIVYIPLLFLFLHLLVTKKQIKYLFFLILFQTLQILAGHPRPTYYTILCISFFLLFFSSFSLKKRLMLFASYGVGFLALSAIQLAPLIEGIFYSTRPLSSISYASLGSLSPAHLLTFFFPTFFGSHAYGTWWGPQIELYGYLGIPAYFLLFIAVLKGKVINKAYYIISLFLTLFLAIGKISLLYILFYYFVPGWRQFRDPIDIMILFTFFVSILAACGFDFVLKTPIKINKTIQKVVLTFVIGLLFVEGLYVWSARQNFWIHTIQFMYTKFHIHQLSRLLVYDSHKLQIMFDGITWNVVIFLLLCTMTIGLFILFAKRKLFLARSLLLLTTISFIYFDSSVVMTTSKDVYAVSSPINFLKDVQNGEYRILSLPIDLHQNRNSLVIPDFFYKESRAKLSTLQANFNVTSGIYQARGFTTLTPGSFAAYIQENPKNIIDIDFSHVTQKQLNETSIKYIISYDKLSSFSAPLTLIAQKDASYYLYKNPLAYKRAYLLQNSSVPVTITTINTQKMQFELDSPILDNLIVANWYYPGWQAKVNGKDVAIKPYEGTFQMIGIPKGKSIVVLTYRSVPFIIGLWTTCISSVVGFILFFVLRRKSI